MHATFLEALGGVFRAHALAAGAHAGGVRQPATARARHGGIVRRRGGRRGRRVRLALVRGRDWFLASLFISPAAQGRGVGPALLDAVGARPTRQRARSRMRSSPRYSNVLYGRRGLIPATPLLTFSGVPRIEAPAVDEREADIAAIDDAAYGFDRDVDHRFWAQFAHRRAWGDAYSYAFRAAASAPSPACRQEPRQRRSPSSSRADGPGAGARPGLVRELVEVFSARDSARAGPRPPAALARARGADGARAVGLHPVLDRVGGGSGGGGRVGEERPVPPASGTTSSTSRGAASATARAARG